MGWSEKVTSEERLEGGEEVGPVAISGRMCLAEGTGAKALR